MTAGGARISYPFSAVVGQDQLRLALMLLSVDPGIGGVLIRGQKGTAKTTTVRGLAERARSSLEERVTLLLEQERRRFLIMLDQPGLQVSARPAQDVAENVRQASRRIDDLRFASKNPLGGTS